MVIPGAWLAHLVEQAPIYRGLLLDAVAVGSTPTCGPFAAGHSPSLSPFKSKLSYPNKGLKMPQKMIKRKRKARSDNAKIPLKTPKDKTW